jgi:hypothetical protein
MLRNEYKAKIKYCSYNNARLTVTFISKRSLARTYVIQQLTFEF